MYENATVLGVVFVERFASILWGSFGESSEETVWKKIVNDCDSLVSHDDSTFI